jgi:RNA polymerase sigma factor (sigma-70 family)
MSTEDRSDLLAEYAATGSGTAFGGLVRRHGPMVYRTCLRLLGNAHDAEEASQAVFMILVRKRSALSPRGNLAAWLHRVAKNVAHLAIRSRARRAKHEERAAMVRKKQSLDAQRERGAGDAPGWRDLLDDELDRLPSKQREALVLRYLENRSEKESAAIAGCPQGTLSRRASDGMASLRRRLVRRGVDMASGTLAGVLVAEASVQIPATLVSSLLAVPQVIAGGTAGSNAGVLAKGVMKMAFWTRVKVMAVTICAVAAVGVGTPFAYRALAAGTAPKAGNGKEPAKTDTALGRLAASLKPGEMKEFKTGGYTPDLLKSWYPWDHDDKGTRIYGAQKMFNIMTGGWANDGKWDPKTRQVLYLGTGHYAALKFVTYSADTNAWTLEPVPPPLDPRRKDSVCARDKKTGRGVWPRSHTYDGQFIDPEGRIFGIVWRPRVFTYDIDKKKWAYQTLKHAMLKNASMPAEYFPEMKGVLYKGRGGLLHVNPLTGAERVLGKASVGLHGVMEYNPVYKAVLVGGGGGVKGGPREVSLVTPEGKIRELKPLPVSVNCIATSKLMCDPVSGEYIVQEPLKRRSKKERKVYALHPVLNEWKEIPGLRFPLGVAVPVSTYGVIMICTGRKVYVYKHKPVWPDDVPGKGGDK